jgi:hypothetical protein
LLRSDLVVAAVLEAVFLSDMGCSNIHLNTASIST